MATNEREIHALAEFVHGALAALHALGIVYNARQRNWVDVAVHTAIFCYDVTSAINHRRKAHNGRYR